MADYSPNSIGQGEGSDIRGSKKAITNLRETENAAESADAAVRHYAHPVENHFAPTGARGPLGRGISRDLAKQLSVQDE